MGAIASQITSLAMVYSAFYSGVDQGKHQSSASLAFVWGIHRDRWIPRTKGQLRGKCFHLMTSSCSDDKSVVLTIIPFRCSCISAIGTRLIRLFSAKLWFATNCYYQFGRNSVWRSKSQSGIISFINGPLTRYVRLRLVHAPGMPGTFSLPPRVSDPDMYHGTCVTRVPWCMPGSLISGFLWSRWWGKRSQHSRRMHKPQVCVSGKRPIRLTLSY